LVAKSFKEIVKGLAKNLPDGRLTHIVGGHGFGVANSKGKYLQNANIPNLIYEAKGIINNGGSLKAAANDPAKPLIDYLDNNKPVRGYITEVDFGKKIGTNANGNGEYTVMRLIISESGEIFSAIPVANKIVN